MPTATKTSRRWFSINEAAAHLGVTDRTVRNYIARGLIKAHRIKGTRTVRIDRKQLEDLLVEIPTADGAA